MGERREAFVDLQERLGRPGTRMLDRLRQAQAEDGRVDADDLTRAAGEFGWPVAAVTGSATYYADFAEGRRGRRHVRVCEGTSCLVSGRGQQIAWLERALGVRLGECAADGSVSLQGVRCLGYCYDAPAVLDGELPASGQLLGGLFGDPLAAQRRTGPGWVEPLKMRAAEIPYASAVERPVVLGRAGGWRGALGGVAQRGDGRFPRQGHVRDCRLRSARAGRGRLPGGEEVVDDGRRARTPVCGGQRRRGRSRLVR
ncbi:NADH-quinone oxidoreductase subunit NuoE family protein [Micromonospora chersina]